MSVFLKGTRTRAGGGSSRSRHDTRRSELERLIDRALDALARGQAELQEDRQIEMDDGLRFWTRNMPAEVLREDVATDTVAAHVYGWESDVALAEERLEKEFRSGRVVSIDSTKVEIRSVEERAQAMLERSPVKYRDLSLTEKEVIRFRAFMEMRDWEESYPTRRGRGLPVTGYEFVKSFDRPISNGDICRFSELFLETEMEVVFNKREGPVKIISPLRELPAGLTIHRESTGNTHLHMLFDCRKEDGNVAQIPPQVWRSFDEHAARVWAEFVHDPELFREHKEKKDQTEEWKRETRERSKKGLPPNPKPQREADTRDQRLLKLHSQINTDLRTLGLDPSKFRVIDRLGGNRSNEPTRQLSAQFKVAEQEFLHALATGVQLEEVRACAKRAEDLRAALIEVREARKRRDKKEPQLYFTDQQAGKIQRLSKERLGAAQDDQAVRFLLGYQTYMKAQVAASQAAIGRLRNLVGQTEIISEDGKQKLEERKAELTRTKDRDQWRSDLINGAVEEAKGERTAQGKKMPGPLYSVEVCQLLDQLAHQERDAKLASHLWDGGHSLKLTPVRAQETTAIELAREYIARQEMLAAEEEHKGVLETRDRKEPSARKNKQSAQEVAPSELKQKEATYDQARRYCEVRSASVNECLELVGATREEIAPRFLPEELQHFKEYVRQMPQGKERAEFQGAIKRAEGVDLQREREELNEEREQQPGASETKPMPEVSAKVLPEEEAGRLIVDLELAQAKVIALRSDEHGFKEMPHLWISTVQKISLKQVEEQIIQHLKQGEGVLELTARKEQIQHEISEERVRLPQRRAEAESEVKTLTERLERENDARKARGLPMPSGRFRDEDIRELLRQAEGSRDLQLIWRVYEIERNQAIVDAGATRDSTFIRRLEEKYTGLKLEADVTLHQGKSSLAWEQKHPTQIMLPAKDENGKDITTSLDDWHPGKGIKGALRKMTESREHREFREKLEATKDSYLHHRSQRVERQAAYCETLRIITRNCRQLGREYGFHTPAAPDLTLEKIKEIRDYAVKQSWGVRDPWLRECTQAQALQNDRKALASQSRQTNAAPSQPPDPTREERIQKQLAESRAQQERMVRVPLRNPANQDRQSNPIDPNRGERNQTRPNGGRGRGR
jgi:hypothetical protein